MSVGRKVALMLMLMLTYNCQQQKQQPNGYALISNGKVYLQDMRPRPVEMNVRSPLTCVLLRNAQLSLRQTTPIKRDPETDRNQGTNSSMMWISHHK